MCFLFFARFSLAESAAHTSLVRDPRSVKARYRRAIARKERGRLAESLVDLASLLTISPANTEATAALKEISALFGATGNPRISLEDVIAADFPPAFGSPSTLKIATNQSKPASGDYRITLNSDPVAPVLFGCCTTCKITKDRNEIKTCRKVGTTPLRGHFAV